MLKYFTPKRFKDKTKYNRKRSDDAKKNSLEKEYSARERALRTEVVNGVCPTLSKTADVICPISITEALYRCTNCGSDLEQEGQWSYFNIFQLSPGSKIPTGFRSHKRWPQKT